MLQSDQCPLTRRDETGSKKSCGFSDFQESIPSPLISMAEGGSCHKFSILNKATLVGNLVVQVHGIVVGLVR